jgi:hypothetical protein
MNISATWRPDRPAKAAPAAAWTKLSVANTAIKPAVRRVLLACYGDDMTLGELSQLPLSEVLALPGVGRSGADSCLIALSRVIRGKKRTAGPTMLDMVSM